MCKAIREGDEMACSCGLRWGTDEADPHTDDVGPHTGYENPTICYQCDKEVPYIFADSRCKDCTRLTPAEMKGEA